MGLLPLSPVSYTHLSRTPTSTAIQPPTRGTAITAPTRTSAVACAWLTRMTTVESATCSASSASRLARRTAAQEPRHLHSSASMSMRVSIAEATFRIQKTSCEEMSASVRRQPQKRRARSVQTLGSAKTATNAICMRRVPKIASAEHCASKVMACRSTYPASSCQWVRRWQATSAPSRVKSVATRYAPEHASVLVTARRDSACSSQPVNETDQLFV